MWEKIKGRLAGSFFIIAGNIFRRELDVI